MANAAINILGDGSLYDLVTTTGDIAALSVQRVQVGSYEINGTLGLVPPPDGWGCVTNPVDRITAAISYENGVLQLFTCDADELPIDIPSKVTLHIQVPDQPAAGGIFPTPADPLSAAEEEYRRRRSRVDHLIQPLQDLLDIGEGTATTEAKLLQLKRYRVALSRVLTQPGYPTEISWPAEPE